jgi:hypothetical protein
MTFGNLKQTKIPLSLTNVYMGKLRKQTEEIMLKKLIFFITPSGIFPPAWEKRYIGNFIHNI